MAEMIRILDQIDRGMEQNPAVYLHCWGGRGRTGTVVGCYLARHGMAVGEAALDLLGELRQNEPKYRRNLCVCGPKEVRGPSSDISISPGVSPKLSGSLL